MSDAPLTRDTIVIGASAGGVEALQRLLAVFPANLPAAVLVTLHLAPTAESPLARILDRSTPLSVQFAEDGMQTRLGCVYLAPPDRHLVLNNGHMALIRGPLENRSRPAIDPLFRSAAVRRGSRVIGVVLSGRLDDGSAGLLAIKRCGGIALVQDPGDAAADAMPRNAASALGALLDGSHPIEQLGRRIVHLAGTPLSAASPVPSDIALEHDLSEQLGTQSTRLHEMGELVALTCPECSGPLVKLSDTTIERYRCFTGHAFSVQALLADQEDRVERALWAAVRSLEERGNTLLALVRRHRDDPQRKTGGPLEREAAQLQSHAQTLRAILLAQRSPESGTPDEVA